MGTQTTLPRKYPMLSSPGHAHLFFPLTHPQIDVGTDFGAAGQTPISFLNMLDNTMFTTIDSLYTGKH